MERLTEMHYKKSDGYYIRCSERCDKDICDCECEKFCQIVEALGAIEDILGDNYDLDRLRELVEADREGRCVVLSEPMKPMVCKPNESDVFCPNCGETLSGGWPQSDADDHRKMCQCPKCGQSIDDETCVVEELEQDG